MALHQNHTGNSLIYYASTFSNCRRWVKDFRPQDPVLYIRTAWEFNGNWFADNAVGRSQTWIATMGRVRQSYGDDQCQ